MTRRFASGRSHSSVPSFGALCGGVFLVQYDGPWWLWITLLIFCVCTCVVVQDDVIVPFDLWTMVVVNYAGNFFSLFCVGLMCMCVSV